MILIVDYGMGNLGSIANMLKKLGFNSKISADLNDIGNAEKIILPGVGAFDAAMDRINKNGFRELLDRKAKVEKIPVLGICLGMQLLTEGSEEGKLSGLSWIPAFTYRFSPENGIRIPHMGWNEVKISKQHNLVQDIDKVSDMENHARFYFVHSYYVRVKNEDDSILKTKYGKMFDSGICHDNIMGCQFHPEKSHKFGMQILNNFANM